MEPEEWTVGIKTEEGSFSVLTSSSHENPSDIVEIFFPISAPWSEEPLIYEAPLEQVEVNERSMGPERHYAARVEDTVPNSDQLWHIELGLWEYPENTFNMSTLEHTNQIRNATWEAEDLINAIEKS